MLDRIPFCLKTDLSECVAPNIESSVVMYNFSLCSATGVQLLHMHAVLGQIIVSPLILSLIKGMVKGLMTTLVTDLTTIVLQGQEKHNAPANSREFPYLYLLSIQVFRPTEHVALGAALAAQLMDLHHAAKRDQADQGVWGQQTQGHLQGLLEGLQVVVIHTGVQDQEIDQGAGGGTL